MTIYYQDATLTLLVAEGKSAPIDQLHTLPDGSVDCVVTSPPYYGLRDYAGHPDQIGLEETLAEYVARLVEVFAEVHRVLAEDGTLWLNIGDSYASTTTNNGGYSAKSTLRSGRLYAGEKYRAANDGAAARSIDADRCAKNLLGIPWRVAFALQDSGWYLRNAIVWNKPNAMPESVRDRLSNRYELLFLLSRSPRYWFNLDAIREPLTHPDALDRGIVFGGTNAGVGKVGGSARRGGAHRSVYGSIPPGKDRAKNGGPGPHHDDSHPRGRNPGDYWMIDDEPFELPAGMLTSDDAAYIASFIDGEGSISIRRRSRQIQLMLTVVNTHEGVIRWLRDRTGMGQVRQRDKRNERWRQCWEWCATSRQAAQVLFAVYPHFRVKRQQAALALRFMETTRVAGGGQAPHEYHDLRHQMAEDLAALNAGRIGTSRFAVEPASPQPSAGGSKTVDVWSIPTTPLPEAHFAAFPLQLPRRCILAGCKPGGTVLDPFSGAGTTAMAAQQLGRKAIGIDLVPEYHDIALRRMSDAPLPFGEAS